MGGIDEVGLCVTSEDECVEARASAFSDAEFVGDRAIEGSGVKLEAS